jgi:hypothetical protein
MTSMSRSLFIAFIVFFICHDAVATLIYALLMYLLRKQDLFDFCCPFPMMSCQQYIVVRWKSGCLYV